MRQEKTGHNTHGFSNALWHKRVANGCQKKEVNVIID
jgi:hypothetical protein